MKGTNCTFSFSSGTNNGGKAMQKVWLREDDPLDDPGDTMESNPTRGSRSFNGQLMENGQESKGNGMAVGKDDIVLSEEGGIEVSKLGSRDTPGSVEIKRIEASYNDVATLSNGYCHTETSQDHPFQDCCGYRGTIT
ncbi:hypothetical protein J1N35_002554 [Gossypium stocksii]|uniref:Uncharacterized protein n=1 Tax=Gossypium stocksii TaxID=47602 RepID=A0A9D4AMI6_9ROSI|nr:hypothetical protein J1N35_002554 [Gossypium stocksii]